MLRQSLEPEAFVKDPRLLVFGMHQQSANPNAVGCGQNSKDRIFKQTMSELFPLPAHIHRQPRQ